LKNDWNDENTGNEEDLQEICKREGIKRNRLRQQSEQSLVLILIKIIILIIIF